MESSADRVRQTQVRHTAERAYCLLSSYVLIVTGTTLKGLAFHDQYRKVIWQCNNKFENEKKCGTLALDTDTIKAVFIKTYNRLMENRSGCELMRHCLDAVEVEIARQL